MLTANQTLDMSPLGMIFRIVKTSSDTLGASLEMEWMLLPNAGGTPLHIHPTATETYKVIEGILEVNVDGKWQMLREGEELTVKEGTAHTFRNPIDKITRVYNCHSPALRFDEYFEGLSGISQKLSPDNAKLKMNLNAATRLSMLMKKHKREIVSVSPPNFVVSALNLIGKIRRLKI